MLIVKIWIAKVKIWSKIIGLFLLGAVAGIAYLVAFHAFQELGTVRYSVVRESTFASLASADQLGELANGEGVRTSTEEGRDKADADDSFPDPCTLEDVVCEVEGVAEVSGYNAEVGQTDADPFTMANGKRVFDGAVANNCLPFGTQVQIGEKVYTVSDRMNKRYGCDNFDIFFWSHDEAVAFGRKSLNFQVL